MASWLQRAVLLLSHMLPSRGPGGILTCKSHTLAAATVSNCDFSIMAEQMTYKIAGLSTLPSVRVHGYSRACIFYSRRRRWGVPCLSAMVENNLGLVKGRRYARDTGDMMTEMRLDLVLGVIMSARHYKFVRLSDTRLQ